MLSLPELQELLARVTDPARDSFYRRLYHMKPEEPARTIESLEDWRAIPILTKADLSAEPLERRSYLPLAKLDHLRASSGTSGKPPLFSPRTHVRGLEYRLTYHDFKNAVMTFTVPLTPHWHARFLEEHGAPPRVVSLDPKFARASARLARIAGVDALSGFLFHMIALGEHLKREGANEQIKLIEMSGEVCSRAQYEYLRETFPNATILHSYASGESEDVHIGMPCRPITGKEPLSLYHPKHTHYLEILDPETGAIKEPAPGVEGDLLVTSYPGEPSAFPLIRYRIGDTVRIEEATCPHGLWSFTVLGRTELDFLKIPGGVLRADEIARVLRLFSDRVTDRYQLRYGEEPAGDGLCFSAELAVELRTSTDLQKLAGEISRALRVAPSLTYEDGVARGRYAPLVCVPFTPSAGGKTKRFAPA